MNRVYSKEIEKEIANIANTFKETENQILSFLKKSAKDRETLKLKRKLNNAYEELRKSINNIIMLVKQRKHESIVREELKRIKDIENEISAIVLMGM